MTTLEELLSMARDGVRHPATDDEERLARGVLELLGEAQPCGWEEPQVSESGRIEVPNQWSDITSRLSISPDDARHMARMLLRAVDAARGDSDA